jgi:putative tricarboxylic transport membrane protein
MSLLGVNSRLLLAFVSVLIAAVYFYNASLIVVPSMGDPIGPRTFPYLLSGALVLAAVLLVFEHARLRHGSEPSEHEDVEDKVTIEPIAMITVALFVGYLLLFRSLGFILSSALFLTAFLMITNPGKWLVNMAVAVLLPVVFYLVLGRLFGAQLPPGILTIG